MGPAAAAPRKASCMNVGTSRAKSLDHGNTVNPYNQQDLRPNRGSEITPNCLEQ